MDDGLGKSGDKMKQEIIYLAAPEPAVLRIYPAYEHFYPYFLALLSRYHPCKTLPLPDIWVRDFLPVQNSHSGRLFQFNFSPNYANYTSAFTARIRAKTADFFPRAQRMPLKLEGGNLITTPFGQAFCLQTRRLFAPQTEEQLAAETQIKTAAGVEQVVWLPKEQGDKMAHIDGVMQFLGNTLLISDERADPYLAALLQKRLAAIKESCPEVKVEFLPCLGDLTAWGLDARGIYVNFLETSRAVFVPQYTLKEDNAVLKWMQERTPKPVVGVNCAEMARYGGAVRCLTQVYVENIPGRGIGKNTDLPWNA